jgi:hypothetical protein
MTETAGEPRGASKLSMVFAAWHDPGARILNVDLLAVLIAILLPNAVGTPLTRSPGPTAQFGASNAS